MSVVLIQPGMNLIQYDECNCRKVENRENTNAIVEQRENCVFPILVENTAAVKNKTITVEFWRVYL